MYLLSFGCLCSVSLPRGVVGWSLIVTYQGAVLLTSFFVFFVFLIVLYFITIAMQQVGCTYFLALWFIIYLYIYNFKFIFLVIFVIQHVGNV